MAEDIKQFSEEIKKHFDTKAAEVEKRFDEKTEEVKHHMDVVAEGLHSDIQAVAEGVEVANDRLDRLEGLPEKVDAISDDVEAIKVTMNTMQQDIGSIKHDLKQKADREELSALEVKLRPAV